MLLLCYEVGSLTLLWLALYILSRTRRLTPALLHSATLVLASCLLLYSLLPVLLLSGMVLVHLVLHVPRVTATQVV